MAEERKGRIMITNHAEPGRRMLRRIAVLGAGLAMVACFGLAGVGTASAAAPDLIKNDTAWTIKVNGAGCEVETFNTSKGTFSSLNGTGDAGTFTQTATTVKMKWTAGGDTGLKFTGTKASATKYKGKFGGIGVGLTGQLVKGVAC
jgi:hypothetical protein